VILLKLCDGRL